MSYETVNFDKKAVNEEHETVNLDKKVVYEI